MPDFHVRLLLKTFVVTFFNLTLCRAKLRTVRKITTDVAILSPRPCDETARFVFRRAVKCLAAMAMAISFANGLFAADPFEALTGTLLRTLAEKAVPLEQLSSLSIGKLRPLAKNLPSPCLIVETDEGNYCKLMATYGIHKGADGPKPVVIFERFVTYKVERPGQTASADRDTVLFGGFQLNLDLGQVVPAGHGGDLALSEDGTLKAIPPARMFYLDPGTNESLNAVGSQKLSATPGPKGFRGSWNFNADGRWVGVWTLDVDATGKVTGEFVSADSSSRYETTGHLLAQPHLMEAEILFANADLTVEAGLWTTDQSRMAGMVTLAGRKFGFFAERVLEDGGEDGELLPAESP